MESEIIDNLKDKMNLKILEKILEQNKLKVEEIFVNIDNSNSTSNINNV
jgi:hypothetical protein